MLCKYGCGNKGIKKLKNGSWICSKLASQCPEQKKKTLISRRKTGYGHTEHTKAKISKSHIGLKQSEETKLKRSLALKGRQRPLDVIEKIKNSSNRKRFNKGHTPWNKGTTGLMKTWNKGLRKQEPIEILNRHDPVYANFKKYRNRVAVRSRKNYLKHKHSINPKNYKLGRAGIKGAYQVDHIVSVRKGFEKGISVEKIAHQNNLQVLPWLENIRKYDGKKKENKLVDFAQLIN